MGPALSAAIALLSLGLQFKSLSTMPRSLLKIFLVGALASIFAGVVLALVFYENLGENSPKLAAQLAASYIGGSENAVIVAKIYNVPNDLFVAVFTIDTIVTSLWMFVTIFLMGRKSSLSSNSEGELSVDFDSHGITMAQIFACLSLALLCMIASEFFASYFGFFHPMLYLTSVGLTLGRIRSVQKFANSAYILGALLLSPFFFCTGAIANLGALSNIPRDALLMPVLLVSIHGAIIFAVAWAWSIPRHETSLASQALIGGSGTAMSLAHVKDWRSGVTFGLVLGLVGYAIANYCGAAVFHISTLLIGWMNQF